jgi:hypothetical protein
MMRWTVRLKVMLRVNPVESLTLRVDPVKNFPGIDPPSPHFCRIFSAGFPQQFLPDCLYQHLYLNPRSSMLFRGKVF